MMELLYLLEMIIPNLGEVIGMLGFFILIFGLVNTFFGYKLFNVVLAILGFLGGAAIGGIMCLNEGLSNNNGVAWICIFGFIGATLAGIFHKLGVFVAVGIMSAIIVFIIVPNTEAALVIGAFCGIVGVFLEKYVVIIITALSGGSIAAMGCWFIGIAKGENINVQGIGWLLGILGMAIQIWMTTRKKETEQSESMEDVGWGTIILEAIIEVISSLRENPPREILHNLIYKENSNEINPAVIKSLIVTPIFVGIILGVAFQSVILMLGSVAMMYVLLMFLFIRKHRAEKCPEKYVQKFAWEKWITKIMDNNRFVIFIPLFPGIFILILFSTFVENELLSIGITLYMIIGMYFLFFKGLTVSFDERIQMESQEDSQDAKRTEKLSMILVGISLIIILLVGLIGYYISFADGNNYEDITEKDAAVSEAVVVDESVSFIDYDSTADEICFDGISISKLLNSSSAELVQMFGGGYNTDGNGRIAYNEIEFYMLNDETVDIIWSVYPEYFSVNGYILDTNIDGVTSKNEVIELLGQNFEEEWYDSGYYVTYYYPDYAISFGINKFSELSEIVIYNLFSDEDDHDYFANYFTDLNQSIEYFQRFGGSYAGNAYGSTMYLSIYSSLEEGEVSIGNAEVCAYGGQYYYFGSIIPLGNGTYMVETDIGDEVLLVESEYSDFIGFEMYVNGQFIDEYWLVEHYMP